MRGVAVEAVEEIWVPTTGQVTVAEWMHLVSRMVEKSAAGFRPIAVGVRFVKATGRARLLPRRAGRSSAASEGQ